MNWRPNPWKTKTRYSLEEWAWETIQWIISTFCSSCVCFYEFLYKDGKGLSLRWTVSGASPTSKWLLMTDTHSLCCDPTRGTCADKRWMVVKTCLNCFLLLLQIMQLLNQIIYGNIYSGPGNDSTAVNPQPEALQSLREGVLLLHRGGLASLKWVKYVYILITAALKPASVM